MPTVALELDHVFKKFRKGEIYDSLRDLIPALTSKIIKGQNRQELEKREFWALRDICFQVQAGEAFGIIGSNGAGKSTILKILSGILKPNMGTIKVNGKLSALIEVSAGFHPDLTGRENIYLNGAIMGMKREEIRRRFDEIVAFSDLADFIDTPVKRYSSGMFARLGFSVAAHIDSDILIVDEVLSVGDFVFQKKCEERMKQVIYSGATVIFVSHNLRAVSDLCTRSLLLDRGRVLEIGPTNKVIQQYLRGAQERRAKHSDQEVFISELSFKHGDRQQIHFQAGEKAFLDVAVSGHAKCERLAVVIAIKNADLVEVFTTSTERLGAGNFSLGEGQTVVCTFALDMHLAAGTYYVSSWIHRYDINKTYDRWDPAVTFFVSAKQDIKGIANLYPTVSVGPLEEHPITHNADLFVTS